MESGRLRPLKVLAYFALGISASLAVLILLKASARPPAPAAVPTARLDEARRVLAELKRKAEKQPDITDALIAEIHVAGNRWNSTLAEANPGEASPFDHLAGSLVTRRAEIAAETFAAVQVQVDRALRARKYAAALNTLAEYHPYAQRGPIDWTDRHGLRAFTKRLIGLRRDLPALHSRRWLPLAVEHAEPVFAYLRTDDADDNPVVVLLNLSGTDREGTVELPAVTAAAFGSGGLTDLWTGATGAGPAYGRLTVRAPGWGFRILTAGPHPNPSPIAMGEGLFPPRPRQWARGAGG